MGYYMHIGDEDFNITYNVSPMFYSHNTDGIRFIYGKTGLEARKLILDMLNYFADNESKLVALEPIEHKSLAGLLQQQDKEFRDLMKIHAREILDFKGDKDGRVIKFNFKTTWQINAYKK